MRELYRDEEVPKVSIVGSEEEARERRRAESGTIVLLKKRIFEGLELAGLSGAAAREKEKHVERVIVAIAKLLDGYDLFEKLSYQRQQEILRDIATIIAFRPEE